MAGPMPETQSASALPPSEVFVRTMESDLASMRETGGGRPQPERVVMATSGEAAAPPSPKRALDVTWLIGIAAVAVFLGVAVAYYFLHFSFSSLIPASLTTPANQGQGAPSAAAPAATPAPSAVPSAAPDLTAIPMNQGVRFSLWKKPSDDTLTFVAGGPASSAADLGTPSQKIAALLAAAAPGAKLVEIIPQDASGTPLSLVSFLGVIDGAVLGPQTLVEHFRSAFSYFAYRAADGWHPGLALALKPGENWLFLKAEVSGIENSPKLQNYFLASPGAPTGGFRDASVAGNPVREISFGNGVFVYGWYHGDLVLGTSEDGMAEAFSRL